ncbi:MAG: hypothetical protein EP330_24730 [Deltaproteobacteria bacterium]|nr:MAG: hypothetical protein EP330_24730 [Deltaproteobacteria bacterium]
MRTALSLALLLPQIALAAPGFIPVQGVLTDSTGAVVDGAVDVTFTLYADGGGTTSLWTDTITIDVVDGRFATELGGGTIPLDLDTFKTYGAVHLGIQVSGDSPMPLVPMDHVPYAAHAAHAADANTLGGATLSEIQAQVPLVSDIEQAALAVCLPDTYVPDWTDLTNRPAGLDDGDDVLSQAEVEGFARGVAYDTLTELRTDLDSIYLPTSYAPAWTDITGRPSGLDDGDDVLSQSTVEGYARDVAYDTPAELTSALAAAGSAVAPASYAHTIRLASSGNNAGASRGVWIDGARVHTTTRSYGLVVIQRSTGDVTYSGNFDVYGSAANADLMAAVLEPLGRESLILVTTYDEPRTNRLSDANADGVTLYDELLRCGASASRFGNDQIFRHRGAYVLAGICGNGPGSGLELYSGEADSNALSAIDTQFVLRDGQIAMSGNDTPAPRTLVYEVTSATLTSANATPKVDVPGLVASFTLKTRTLVDASYHISGVLSASGHMVSGLRWRQTNATTPSDTHVAQAADISGNTTYFGNNGRALLWLGPGEYEVAATYRSNVGGTISGGEYSSGALQVVLHE